MLIMRGAMFSNMHNSLNPQKKAIILKIRQCKGSTARVMPAQNKPMVKTVKEMRIFLGAAAIKLRLVSTQISMNNGRMVDKISCLSSNLSPVMVLYTMHAT